MSLLYEDEFVSVNECALNIKNFHFPSKKTKHVPIQAITVLWFEVCKLNILSGKQLIYTFDD